MSDRRPRWTWGLSAALLAVGLIATFVRPTAPALPPMSELATSLTQFASSVDDRVAAWVGPIRIAYLMGLTVTLVAPWLLVMTDAGRALLMRVGGRRLATLRGAVLVPLLLGVVSFPLRWWIGWVHAGRFGFRTASFGRFLTEDAGAVLLEAVLLGVGATAALWLVRRRPTDWPAVGTLAGVAATAVLVLVQPLVVTELLYDPQPLTDPAVLAAVGPVVERSDLPDLELEVGAASVRTTRINAYVVGVGPTQRVVLWDTLLQLPVDRVAAVVGHEIAHAEHRDIPRGIAASAAGILPTLLLVALLRRRFGDRILGAGDARGTDMPVDRASSDHQLRGARAGAVVVALLITAQVLGQPVVAWQSRRIEAAADARTLELVRDPAGFVALSRGFVEDDLADPDPPGWVRFMAGTHPTASQRIRAAAAFAEREGIDLGPAPTTGQEG